VSGTNGIVIAFLVILSFGFWELRSIQDRDPSRCEFYHLFANIISLRLVAWTAGR
jgi:hypothetical protein